MGALPQLRAKLLEEGIGLHIVQWNGGIADIPQIPSVFHYTSCLPRAGRKINPHVRALHQRYVRDRVLHRAPVTHDELFAIAADMGHVIVHHDRVLSRGSPTTGWKVRLPATQTEFADLWRKVVPLIE